MKHNNEIPKNHFRKHWQTRVKTWFDQAGSKKSRRVARANKAASTISSLSKLRPAVRCPTIKYNMKLRFGRGFTKEELKVYSSFILQSAGISRKYAKTIGIAVDHRRRNRSVESLNLNSDRLKQYLQQVKILNKASPKSTSRSLEIKKVFAISNSKPSYTTEEITDEIKKVPAYVTLRKAWGMKRHAGIRAKRAAAKAEEAANSVGKSKQL